MSEKGPRVIEGNLIGTGKKFALVVSRFNEFITGKLVTGAQGSLIQHGVKAEDITVVWVPGAFEVPLAAKKLVEKGDYHAIICLAAVIRGATPHFDYVCNEAAKGVARVGLDSGQPVLFGILTTETIEQAIERAGTKAGNKGAEAAMAALEMANLWEIL